MSFFLKPLLKLVFWQNLTILLKMSHILKFLSKIFHNCCVVDGASASVAAAVVILVDAVEDVIAAVAAVAQGLVETFHNCCSSR